MIVLVILAGIWLAIGALFGLAFVAAHQGWIDWLVILNRAEFDRADRECGSDVVAWWLFAYVMVAWPFLMPKVGH